MKELPEPEGYELRDATGFFGQASFAKFKTGDFTRDQVLAIQKQAYEDGLKDALFAVNTTTIPVALQSGWDDAARLAKEVCADSVQTLLTASQEKK